MFQKLLSRPLSHSFGREDFKGVTARCNSSDVWTILTPPPLSRYLPPQPVELARCGFHAAHLRATDADPPWELRGCSGVATAATSMFFLCLWLDAPRMFQTQMQPHGETELGCSIHQLWSDRNTRLCFHVVHFSCAKQWR